MPKVTEAIRSFLQARQTPANADLVARWSASMETQVNVAAGRGEPVDGKRSTYSDGVNSWHNIRIPKNANADPSWEDYSLTYPLDEHAEGIGSTGWDWAARKSRWVAFDFDHITSHAAGIGVTDEELARVREAAKALPYVQVRRSTGGLGLHLYVYLDGIPTDNHTEHAALARCILGMMAGDTNFDFASQIDCCGGVTWIWHRKMTPANGGLSLLKDATKVLTEADLPKNWRDHIEVVRGRRAKVRINGISDENLSPFEAKVNSRKMTPLDDSHKKQIEALQQSGYTTLWVSDHHLLQTHTCALAKLMEESQEELGLIGYFKTISNGRDPGSPNCFMFPLPNGAWHVYRFSPGINEAETWTQDGDGWTACYFNRTPDLTTAAKAHGGLKDPDKGDFVFDDTEAAILAAQALGQAINFDDLGLDMEGRDIRFKSSKEGRLIVAFDRHKDDPKIPGWLAKKDKWIREFDVNTTADDEEETCEWDNLIRAIKTPAKQFVGWMIHESGEWVAHPSPNVKMLLQNMGNAKSDAEAVMGGAIAKGWRIINLPFREEYPGGRQWNVDAAQFKYKIAELSDDEVPRHPHWDKILTHIGQELDAPLKESPWAIRANIRTGAEYLRAWVACALRDPFEPSPYLFMFGSENCGKSIFHEALDLLITKGVVSADRPLTSSNDFNGELANAIFCVVEEKDISKSPGAHNRIKEWVTCRNLSIRKMRTDSYRQPNTTHWIQCANKQENCPVFPGDTRITVVYVPELLPTQEIPKKILLEKLAEEAPHFMFTLMNMELPPVEGRLRLPVVATSSKMQSEEFNQNSLEEFVRESCYEIPGAKVPFRDFYDKFYTWLPSSEKGEWTKRKCVKNLPHRFPVGAGSKNQKYIGNLSFEPVDVSATMQRLVNINGYLKPEGEQASC